MMRKLLLLSVVLLAVFGCSKQDEMVHEPQLDETAVNMPSFYGMAMLDESDKPKTRGVANSLKVWSNTIAENNLTVKFLNGSQAYRKYVREAAEEWMKYGGIRFIFVNDDQPALIRVGFDHVPGMMSSWALTGTDHIQVYGNQTEPTVHFAQWRRGSDAQKRSDVLRAFGQVLGLELEFRHPNFYPAWITDSGSNIDEATIRDYWEYELADYISWAELKKIVLDPLSNHTFLIAKTEHYDQFSVMSWPFYEMIARNIPVIEFDADHNTELSDQDKAFIKTLYGKTFNGRPRPEQIVKLIEFDFTGISLRFNLTTTKNLVVLWDDENDFTAINLPTDTTTVYNTGVISHSFAQSKSHRIIIGEVLAYGQPRPLTSTALRKFDLWQGNYVGKMDIIQQMNLDLEYFRVIGGPNFASQNFNFTGFDNLKEVYLVETMDSKVTVDNCPKLEKLATSRTIWKPTTTTPLQLTSYSGTPVDNIYPIVDYPMAIWPPILIHAGWPNDPEPYHSLSDVTSKGVNVSSCLNIKEISLEHTRAKNIDLSNLENLEYLYLSSQNGYIVNLASQAGAGSSATLATILSTLPDRTGRSTGVVVVRGIESTTNFFGNYHYGKVSISGTNVTNINKALISKNWKVVWESGVSIWKSIIW